MFQDSSVCVRRLVTLFVLPLLGLLGCDGSDRTRVITVRTGDGLKLTITSVAIREDSTPVVELTIEDDDGNPLELSDLDSEPSFVIGFVSVDPDSGQTRRRSHLVEEVEGGEFDFAGETRPPALKSAAQATSDSGGEFRSRGRGRFRYTFGGALPADFDRDAVHSVGVWASRQGRTAVSNDVFTFVPSGREPSATRELVVTETCNACHGTLEFHGGVRRDVALCVICHTDQTVDPESGENLEFAHMIHAIHHGRDLTNLPYFLVGFRQRVIDYSRVAYPQDDRNCTACHDEEIGAAGAPSWRTQPNRLACGGCHDDVDFSTGENHSGGIQQLDDALCTRCHRETQVVEFDNSVPGAHVVPYESSLNPGLTLEITDVQSMTPGSQPALRLRISDRSGPLDIASLDRVAVVFGGPTADFTQLISVGHAFTIQGGGAVGTLTTNAAGDYTFTPDGYAIPADATGTWSLGLEARTRPIQAGPESIRFGANNPVVDIDLAAGSLGGGSPAPRRQVVDEAACDRCHQDLRIHGNLRTEIPYCLLCHNPWATDERRRPELDPAANPPESVDFKYMVHKIHRGEDLAKGYTVFGFGSAAISFDEVVFPRPLQECGSCHTDGSQLLPLPNALSATVVNIAGAPVPGPEAVRPPATAACTSCHDDDASVTHARLNAVVEGPTMFAESCTVCHGEGSVSAVSAVHADR